MRIRNNKLIYVVLSILVLLLGMHIDNIKTEAAFAYASVEQQSSHILLHSVPIDDIELCTAVLGNGYNASVQQLLSRYIRQKWEIKISLDFLCAEVSSLVEGRFFGSSEVMQSHKRSLEELVSNYIHKTDGKKRI